MEIGDFVPNWMRIQTLGEGAFGEVILLKHRSSAETIAAKVIDVKKHKDAKEASLKESHLHKCLTHPNIIRFFGQRSCTPDHPFTYLYLEYAAGGELFNKIEPDLGLGHADAQKYIRQLLDGLEYIHKRGIVHRDIKPENLLLDAHDNLKISDFGLATVFRLKGKERLMTRSCGTLPYVAPEVLGKSYRAEPADIWSCGIVLVTLVAGELPWNQPTLDCEEYENWITDQYLLETPWSKLDNVVINLAKKILCPDPKSRHTIEQIRCHSWMLAKFSMLDSTALDGGSGKTLWRCPSMLDGKNVHDPPSVTLSQPIQMWASGISQNVKELLRQRESVCFSQPTQNDDLFTSSEAMTFSQNQLTKSDFKHLIQRMTRFFVKTDCEKTIEILGSLLDSMHYTWNTDPLGGVITISTVDSRKMQLVFKANMISMDGKLLLDFRLYKGCGLEFKRRFMKIKQCLLDIILNVP